MCDGPPAGVNANRAIPNQYANRAILNQYGNRAILNKYSTLPILNPHFPIVRSAVVRSAMMYPLMPYSPVPGGTERIERERQEADRKYHDLFAELDRIVNEAASSLPLDDPAAARLATFQSVLVQFLQQITPYIDTKIRAVEQQIA